MAIDYTFSGGLAPADYSPNKISELANIIGKVAFQVIREVNAKDPLNVFEKQYIENGDTIEQIIVKLASPRAYDSTGANALSRKTPSIVAKYFKEWNRLTYDTTVDVPQIRKILLTGKGTGEVSSKIVASLGEGDKHEVYTTTKNLLKWGRQVADGGTNASLKNYGTIAFKNNDVDYKGILKAIKNSVDGMKFVNSDFNTGSVVRSTREEDIYILMPYKLYNSIDVDDLAGVFNLDKAEIKQKLIKIDTDVESHYQYVYIVDKNAILRFMRLYMMVDQVNADGLFWNYFLHTDRMYAISNLFDCGYLKVQWESLE